MTITSPIRLLLVCTLLLWSLAAGLAAQKYGVTVEAQKTVNYAAFKTYTWTTGRPSPDKTVDDHIKTAVDRELSALGLTKAPAGADVLVSYSSVRRTDVDVNAKPDAKGSRPTHSVGTLVVGLLDPHSRKS